MYLIQTSHTSMNHSIQVVQTKNEWNQTIARITFGYRTIDPLTNQDKMSKTTFTVFDFDGDEITELQKFHAGALNHINLRNDDDWRLSLHQGTDCNISLEFGGICQSIAIDQIAVNDLVDHLLQIVETMTPPMTMRQALLDAENQT